MKLQHVNHAKPAERNTQCRFVFPANSHRRSALTFIECVVASSSAALAAASAWALTREAGQQDQLARCLANMRAIGQAGLTYAAEDPSEMMIPVPNLEPLGNDPTIFEWGGRAGIGEPHTSGGPHTSRWGTGAWRGPAHRPLNRYLYRAPFIDWNPVEGPPQPGAGYANYIRDTQLDLDVYRCPSDSGYAGGGFMYTGGRHRDISERPFAESGLTAFDHYGSSYTAVAFLTASGGPGVILRSNSVFFRAVSSVPAPSQSLAYQEVPARCAWLWGDWVQSPCALTGRQDVCIGNFNLVPGWHGIAFGFNATFADGHAGNVRIQGCMRPAPNLGSTNYPDGCGATIPGHDCFGCVIIRGPGWQLDTLPAAGIPTPWSN